MEEITKREKAQIAEFAKDITQMADVAQFNSLLDNDPPQTWVKDHPYNKTKVNGRSVPVPYMPVGIVESLLNAVFPINRVEVVSFGQLAQSVTCHVRVHYKHPALGEWLYHDGVGAVDIQTAKNSSAADLASINAGAIQKGLPAAKAYAFKNACANFGRLFGRDIAREHTVVVAPKYDYKDDLKQLKNG